MFNLSKASVFCSSSPSSSSPPFPPSLFLDRLQRLRQFQAIEAEQARTEQLKQTAAFKQHDDGSGASVLMQCVQGNSMWAVCNDAFTARVHEATALWDKALQRQLVMAYLIAPIYAAEDRGTRKET